MWSWDRSIGWAAAGWTMAKSRPQASSTESVPSRAPRERVMEGRPGERILIPPSGAKLGMFAHVGQICAALSDWSMA
jgi:hypothetical protein